MTDVTDSYYINKIRRDNLVRLGEAFDRMYEKAIWADKQEDIERYVKRVMDILPGLKPIEKADPYAGMPTLNINITHGHIQTALTPAPVVEDVSDKLETLEDLATPVIEPGLPTVPKEALTIEALIKATEDV